MRIFPVLLGGFLFLGTLQSHAQDVVQWKTVGDWKISVDRTLNYGCFMLVSYTRGTVVRIGFNQKALNGYILVGNSAWRSLEVGKEYPLALQYDDETPWRGTSTGVSFTNGSNVYLFLPFSKPTFIGDFARREMLSIWYREQIVTKLPLKGSYAAAQELIVCQKTIDAARAGTEPSDARPTDPFAKGIQRSDPFASGGPRVVSDPFSRRQ
jgi:hypothetical protein